MIIQWTPEGRRLVTGASSGEFTLWNGLTFNFETILQVFTDTSIYTNSTAMEILCILEKNFNKGLLNMAPLNEHYQFTVILCFLCTDILVKFFRNFHFDLNAHTVISDKNFALVESVAIYFPLKKKKQ